MQLLGFASGKRERFVSPNARDTNMLVLSFALGDAKVPNANDFALQWNIGFRIQLNGELHS